jgi:hypothetical protein
LTDAAWDLEEAAWTFYELHTRYRVVPNVGVSADEERQVLGRVDSALRVLRRDYDLPPSLSAFAKGKVTRINNALLDLKTLSTTAQEPEFKETATQIQDACEQIRDAAQPYAYRSSS